MSVDSRSTRTEADARGVVAPVARTQARPPGRRRPNLSGDLVTLLQEPPSFRRRLLGYDRLQVDNYVFWAERELAAGHREREDLFDRCARLRADLDEARRALYHGPRGREFIQLSWRIGSVLCVAADQAEEMTDEAAAEAERITAEARAEAEHRLAKVAEIERRAAADAERIRDEACREAAAARRRDDERAAADRDRLDREAAERRAVLLTEVAQLERRCGSARAELDGMARLVSAALATVLPDLPEDVLPRPRPASYAELAAPVVAEPPDGASASRGSAAAGLGDRAHRTRRDERAARTATARHLWFGALRGALHLRRP